jgi:DNA-binding transcriptional regulator LsrR (DeoR family)
MRRGPTVAVAYRAVRAPAVKAAIRGGLVDSLVTHASPAETLLDDAEHRPWPRA